MTKEKNKNKKVFVIYGTDYGEGFQGNYTVILGTYETKLKAKMALKHYRHDRPLGELYGYEMQESDLH